MRKATVTAVAALLPLLAACGGASGGGSGAGPVKVGLAVSLSGAEADTGTKLRDGAQLWVDEGHKILGRDVELTVRDDESSPATAARLYERLITVDDADALIGPYGSGPSAAVAKVTKRHNRFILMTGASAASIFKGSKTAVQLMSPQLHLPAPALKLASEKGYKTVAAAAIDNPYGQEVLSGIKMYTAKEQMQLLSSDVYPEDARDLSSLIIKMKKEQPDVVYVGAYVPDGVLFMRQAKEQGLNPKMYVLGATGPVTPEFVKGLGATAEYVMGTAQWVPQANYPGVDKFVAAWKKAHPDKPVDYVQATGYAAMDVLSRIAKDAGSLDDEALLKAAHAADYKTLYGPFKVDEDGIQIAQRGVVTQIQNGKIVPVYPSGMGAEPKLPTPPWSDR